MVNHAIKITPSSHNIILDSMILLLLLLCVLPSVSLDVYLVSDKCQRHEMSSYQIINQQPHQVQLMPIHSVSYEGAEDTQPKFALRKFAAYSSAGKGLRKSNSEIESTDTDHRSQLTTSAQTSTKHLFVDSIFDSIPTLLRNPRQFCPSLSI